MNNPPKLNIILSFNFGDYSLPNINQIFKRNRDDLYYINCNRVTLLINFLKSYKFDMVCIQEISSENKILLEQYLQDTYIIYDHCTNYSIDQPQSVLYNTRDQCYISNRTQKICWILTLLRIENNYVVLNLSEKSEYSEISEFNTIIQEELFNLIKTEMKNFSDKTIRTSVFLIKDNDKYYILFNCKLPNTQ